MDRAVERTTTNFRHEVSLRSGANDCFQVVRAYEPRDVKIPYWAKCSNAVCYEIR